VTRYGKKTFVLSSCGYSNPEITYTYPGNISLPHYNKYQDRDDVGSGTGDYGQNSTSPGSLICC
jgi:hypothetical protein